MNKRNIFVNDEEKTLVVSKAFHKKAVLRQGLSHQRIGVDDIEALHTVVYIQSVHIVVTSSLSFSTRTVFRALRFDILSRPFLILMYGRYMANDPSYPS